MKIDKQISEKVLKAVESGKIDARKAALGLADTLSDRNLTYLLPGILREIKKSTAGKLQKGKLIIRTASKEDFDQKVFPEEIENFSGKTQITEEGSLIAGSKIRFKGKEFDTSVKSQTSRFYRSLIS